MMGFWAISGGNPKQIRWRKSVVLKQSWHEMKYVRILPPAT